MAQGNEQDPFSPQREASPSRAKEAYGAAVPQPGKPSKSNVIIASLIFWAGYLACIAGCGVAAAAYPPMRTFEVVLVVSIAALPVAYLLINLLLAQFPSITAILAKRRRRSGPSPVWVIKLTLFIPVMAGLYGLVIGLNGMIDHSPVTPYTLTIMSKSYTTSKNGNRHYYGVVDSPVKPMLPFAFDTTEHVATNSTTYQWIQPGVTQVTIDTHDGYFGIPWMAAHHFVGLNSAAAVTANPAPQNTAPAATADDTDWGALTEFDMSIDPIPPDAMNREYWPNGYPKQEEPMVHGQIHGIAHYWFDNGKLYADIPWNHGKKHGRFKLYRPDGTLDQILSMKEGQPHGILEWYNRDGSLQQKWVYVDGVARKRLK